MRALACPDKYKQMGDFYEYYSGERKAPLLTLFIGGNHEASNYLKELYHGGWVAENIYFMGYSNVVKLDGLVIAGISGIFKGYDYNQGFHECYPFTNDS